MPSVPRGGAAPARELAIQQHLDYRDAKGVFRGWRADIQGVAGEDDGGAGGVPARPSHRLTVGFAHASLATTPPSPPPPAANFSLASLPAPTANRKANLSTLTPPLAGRGGAAGLVPVNLAVPGRELGQVRAKVGGPNNA